MFEEKFKVSGIVKIDLIDQFGNLKKTEVSNLVVTAGASFIASRMVAATATLMSHLAVGTSNTAKAAGQTTLVAEIARVTLTGASNSTNTVTYTASLAAGVGTGNLQEAGIFNASSAGTMLARTTFPLLTKESTDTVNITWVISITGS